MISPLFFWAAAKEEKIPTLLDHLQEYLTRPDVVERIRLPQTAGDELLSAFVGFFGLTGAAIRRAAESPASPGYEPWLIERGINPILARMMARLLVRSGNRTAKDNERRTVVVRAIRFHANHGRQKRAIFRKAILLLAAWKETSIIETIFADAGHDEFEFIRLLESVVEGHEAAYHRLTEIAASVAPHLSIRRGPKVTAASAAHEFFLEKVVAPLAPRAYTWNLHEENYTDPVTEATRREFNFGDFNPQSAHRRFKARQNRH